MPDASANSETDIIHAAYADKVKEAFIVFAENLTVGQPEKSCKERFLRSLSIVKKARDLAIEAMSGDAAAELPATATEGAQKTEHSAAAEGGEHKGDERITGTLSAQDRALVDAAVGGTTGHASAPVPGGPLRLR